MKQIHLNLDLTGVVLLIAVGVLLPVMMATAVGIIALVIAKDAGDIVTGVLVVSFAVTAMGSGLITVVLTSRKMRQARLQSDFIANVSHEIRTPLSVIRLYTQTLQSGRVADDPEQTERCLATILRETEWLDAMLDRVLTWRAAHKDRLPLKLQLAPVQPAVSDALDRFRAMVDPAGLSLTTEFSSRHRVLHDRRSLNAVVLNLLINAYKYTGTEKNIHVAVFDEEQTVVIAVRDNGAGVAPAEMQRIFQPFYRVAERSGGRVSGVGLGLAIAHHQVQQHKGRLTVESEVGRGSTFRICLPAVSEDV